MRSILAVQAALSDRQAAYVTFIALKAREENRIEIVVRNLFLRLLCEWFARRFPPGSLP